MLNRRKFFKYALISGLFPFINYLNIPIAKPNFLNSSTINLLNVKSFGAKGNGKTDDTKAIQRAIEEARDKKGIVYLPPGTYLLTDTIHIYSKTVIVGTGKHLTVLKADKNMNKDIIKTINFDKLMGTNSWFVDTEQVVYGFKIGNLTIDGNSKENRKGYGVKIYGKGYTIENVLIKNIAETGFYSECGAKCGQHDYRDMPESLIDLEIRNCGKDGFIFRGPHDTIIKRLIVAIFKRYGCKFERKKNQYSGACDIKILHVYTSSTNWAFYSNVPFRASEIIAESGYGNFFIQCSGCQIGILHIFKNRSNVKPDVLIKGNGNVITNLKIVKNTNSPSLVVYGNFNIVNGIIYKKNYKGRIYISSKVTNKINVIKY